MPARSYTSAEINAAREEGRLQERAKFADRAIETLESFRTDHTKLHEHLEDTLSEFGETLKQAIIIPDPKLREAAPDILANQYSAVGARNRRRAFWTTWQGVTVFLTVVGGFVLTVLTTFGVVGPQAFHPQTNPPVVQVNPSHTP